MGLYLYDEALIQKFKKWTEKTKILLYSPNEFARLIEVQADQKDDLSFKLPAISLTRDGGYEISNPNKRPITYDGKLLESDNIKSISLNAIPIKIEYLVNVYTRYFKEADQYMRNLVFNIINYPTLLITVPYNNSGFVHNANIRISGNVEDNSGSTDLMIKAGLFTRLSLNINIDDAYLWDARVRNVVSIDDNSSAIDINTETIEII